MKSDKVITTYNKIFEHSNTPSQFRKRLTQFVKMWDRLPAETKIEYRLTNHALWDTKCRSETLLERMNKRDEFNSKSTETLKLVENLRMNTQLRSELFKEDTA